MALIIPFIVLIILMKLERIDFLLIEMPKEFLFPMLIVLFFHLLRGARNWSSAIEWDWKLEENLFDFHARRSRKEEDKKLNSLETPTPLLKRRHFQSKISSLVDFLGWDFTLLSLDSIKIRRERRFAVTNKKEIFWTDLR